MIVSQRFDEVHYVDGIGERRVYLNPTDMASTLDKFSQLLPKFVCAKETVI